MNRYNILGTLAMIAVPLAPSVFFGSKVYTGILSTGVPHALAVVVGVAGGFGLESVGIFAGHSATEYWRNGRPRMVVVTVAILAIYVLIGLWELRGTIGASLFLIAPLVYLLVALQDDAERERKHIEQDRKIERGLSLQEKQAEARHRREMEKRELELKHEAKIKRIEAKAPTIVEKKSEVPDSFPTDWRKLTDEDKKRLSDISADEIVEIVNVSPRTAERWQKRLSKNGYNG